LREALKYDFFAIESEVVTAAEKLLKENPAVGGIILECTNTPPFQRAIYDKLGLPTGEIITLGNYLYEAS
jgi:hypothetical protein